jgi:hypothetical protein
VVEVAGEDDGALDSVSAKPGQVVRENRGSSDFNHRFGSVGGKWAKSLTFATGEDKRSLDFEARVHTQEV